MRNHDFVSDGFRIPRANRDRSCAVVLELARYRIWLVWPGALTSHRPDEQCAYAVDGMCPATIGKRAAFAWLAES